MQVITLAHSISALHNTIRFQWSNILKLQILKSSKLTFELLTWDLNAFQSVRKKNISTMSDNFDLKGVMDI